MNSKIRYCVPGILSFLLTAATGGVPSSPAWAEVKLIDDFEGGSMNKVGGRSNTYVMEPSRALAVRSQEKPYSGNGCLLLKYDKKGKGGPGDTGGWCGYYTLLKTGSRYFDASPYSAITFWVRGATGEENFVVGLADRHWDEVGDSVKSEPIGTYLPSRRLTADWQKATIPMETYLLERKELASLAVCFEGTVFPGGAGKGTIYLDDVKLE